MKKPVIGVLPLWDAEKDSIWMLPGYMQGIEAAGGVPVILSLTADEEALGYWAEKLDGFLFTGGQDVDPAVYGEEKLPVCGAVCPERDAIEIFLFKQVIELNKPALGICRGLQLMNAAQGGTLYQDLPAQLKSETHVVHENDTPDVISSHQVDIMRGSLLHSALGTEAITVNSYHHQGVKKLAADLSPAAVSLDGLAEAAFMPGQKFIFAVQWHPELNFLNDQNSYKLFRMFIEAAEYNFHK